MARPTTAMPSLKPLREILAEYKRRTEVRPRRKKHKTKGLSTLPVEWKAMRPSHEIVRDVRAIMEVLDGIVQKQRKRGLALTISPPSKESAVAFEMWCEEQKAENPVGVLVRVGLAEGGGVVAEKAISKGNMLFRIPSSMMIVSCASDGTVSSGFRDCDAVLKGWIAKDVVLQRTPSLQLALRVLLEYKRKMDGKTSFWQPYLDILPPTFDTPLHWSWEEWDGLSGSPVLGEAADLLVSTLKLYTYTYSMLEKEEIDMRFWTWEAFRYAVSVVVTRQNEIPVDAQGSTALALIPLWDMCNHEPGGPMSTQYMVGEGGGVLECTAKRDFVAGEQVTIFYGERSSAEFLLHSGFVPLSNPHDRVFLGLGEPQEEDEFVQRRAALLKYFPSLRCVGGGWGLDVAPSLLGSTLGVFCVLGAKETHAMDAVEGALMQGSPLPEEVERMGKEALVQAIQEALHQDRGGRRGASQRGEWVSDVFEKTKGEKEGLQCQRLHIAEKKVLEECLASLQATKKKKKKKRKKKKKQKMEEEEEMMMP